MTSCPCCAGAFFICRRFRLNAAEGDHPSPRRRGTVPTLLVSSDPCDAVIGAIAFPRWQLQPRNTMTKKIERSRVEAGKAELPRKVSFLSTEKVDYVLVFDRNGDLSVEVPAAALAKLVKARGELKALKGAQKQADATAGASLASEKEAHQATQAALAKAERRIKSLEKKLEASTDKPAAPAAAAPAAASAPAPAADAKSASKKSAKAVVAKKAPAAKEPKAVAPAADSVATSSALAPEQPDADMVDAPIAAVSPAVN